MKQCPRCHAVVRDDTECPFCHETLTYENPVMQDKPHMPWNRYTVLYWVKSLWFPLACLIVCTVRLLTLPPTTLGFLEIGKDGPLAFIALSLLLCFLAAFVSKDPLDWLKIHHFSESYYKFRCTTTMCVTGAVAVGLSFLLALL